MGLKAFTIILCFLTLRIQQNYCFKNIILKEINLRNSGIDSIEHITMNPTESQYEEYYADYFEEDMNNDDYDHVGDLNDFNIVSISRIYFYLEVWRKISDIGS